MFEIFIGRGPNLDEVTVLARDPVELENIRFVTDPSNNRFVRHELVPVGKVDSDERDVRTLKNVRVEDRAVACDDAGLFEFADSIVDGRTRKANLLRDGGVTDPAVFAKEFEDLAVDPIESCRHLCHGSAR